VRSGKQVNANVPSTVARVLAFNSRIQRLRVQAAQVPGADLRAFDGLEDAALALSYCHWQVEAAKSRGNRGASVLKTAKKLRKLLYCEARSQTARGMVPSSWTAHYSGQDGYENVSSDLFMLASFLNAHWAKIAGKCSTDQAELIQAEKLAAELCRVSGLREADRSSEARLRRKRAQAFLYLEEIYNRVRRVVCFLRWNEGDADAIAPALQGPGKRQKRALQTKLQPSEEAVAS
jgi:hypothetical protein